MPLPTLLLACLALFAPASARALKLPFMASGVELSTDQCEYWRYETVELVATGRSATVSPETHPVLDAQVRTRGRWVAGPGGQVRVPLRWQAERGAWVGRWPIPWGPALGDYEAVLLKPPRKGLADWRYTGPQSAYVWTLASPRPGMARASFVVKGRTPMPMPAGFSVMTLEPGKPGYKHFTGVDGEGPSWRRIMDWARFMEVDAFWHCAAETQVWGELKPDEFPWAHDGTSYSPRLAGLAKRMGLNYGAYALSFVVLGEAYLKAPYTFTTGYDPSTGQLNPRRFISLDDPVRREHLAGFLRRMDAQPEVDYVGLDYMRTDFGGLEFTEAFLAEMALKPDAAGDSPEARMRWLGDIVVNHRDPFVEELWQWWRSQKVARVAKDLLERSQVHKPVWVFSLGWMQGHQHGQDPLMLIDAGISFNAPMYYEVAEQGWPAMLGSWRQYLANSASPATLVIGQPVDGRLLGEIPGEAGGPERLYRRQVQALEALDPVASSLGMFWHDLNRAAAGGRSAYSIREWALAGAAAASRMRERRGVVSVRVSFVGADATTRGIGYVMAVENLTRHAVTGVTVDGILMPGVARFLPARFEVGTIPAMGAVTHTAWALPSPGLMPGVPLMLALRAQAGGEDHSSFAFTYLSPTAAIARRAP